MAMIAVRGITHKTSLSVVTFLPRALLRKQLVGLVRCHYVRS